MTAMLCWHCGADLSNIPQPFSRLAQCQHCHADLHVCRLCKYYNPRLHDQCDHDQAEPARDVTLANFCDYFIARTGAWQEQDTSRADAAMAKLQALFGDTTQTNDSRAGSPQDDTKARFDDLFKKD